ncbi:MAG TPA: sugar ABC transporter permease [Thermomicrobiales bacterium]|nr:sugar ABC transporter permease [Thermomicrobiales bacterium]
MRGGYAGYLFVAPFLLAFLLFFVAPLVYAAYLSVFRQQLVGGTVFVGLDNFARALQDDKLLSGVLRMARFFVLQVPVMLGLALFAALAIDSGLLRFARAFRIGIFIPFAVPGVVAVLMWGYLYGDFGPFTQLAQQFELPIPEFLSPDLALASLANVVTWEYTGYNMIILFTALQAIDRTLYEAAAVDGASSSRIAWSIKIPLLRPAIMLTVLFSVIGSFQLFTEAELLQRIAPTVIDSSYTPNLYTYTLSFIGQQVNYAAAVSFLLGIVIVLVSYVVLIVANRTGRR